MHVSGFFAGPFSTTDFSVPSGEVNKNVWQVNNHLLTLFFIFFGVLTLFAAFSPCVHAATPSKADEKKFFRNAYVLQSIDEEAAQEKLAIPKRTRYDDDTESLLHHPDRIYVLHHIADEMSALREAFPQAKAFEAYAKLALGEQAEATRLLLQYVGDSAYDEHQYTVLARCLDETGDYETLHIICREWAERSPVCVPRRVIFGWKALQNLGRYRDAHDYALKEGGCLGWRSYLYASLSLESLGDAEAANRLVQQAVKENRQNETEILRLWARLSSEG